MNGLEIKERISKLNEYIENETIPAFFVLNDKIKKAQEEIQELKKACPHEYNELGYCIYCDKKVD